MFYQLSVLKLMRVAFMQSPSEHSVKHQAKHQRFTKANLGLGNAHKTADANKPISASAQGALNSKLDILNFTKAGICLSNVDHTADANEHISGLTQSALIPS